MVVTQSPASALRGHATHLADAPRRESSGADVELHLAETRHRLANCLTLINGLIGVRLRGISDSESRRHLMWLLEVVTSLGVLQQRMVERNDDDFALYLGDVAEFWRQCGIDRHIAVELEADSIVLPTGRSSSLALIVHELVSNAFEHAFAPGQGGTVGISLKRTDEACHLTIRDNGQGVGSERPGEGRMGLAIVKSLARRLGGEAEIVGGPGTSVMVRFPVGDPPATEMSTTERDGYGCVSQCSKLV